MPLNSAISKSAKSIKDTRAKTCHYPVSILLIVFLIARLKIHASLLLVNVFVALATVCPLVKSTQLLGVGQTLGFLAIHSL
ncbi:hypothetical protein DMC01_02545 [Campylobacter troglodytis]|nr:hypothetical protein DMC01_02545 [Campylobacter troglodytis]